MNEVNVPTPTIEGILQFGSELPLAVLRNALNLIVAL
jgi:hypothetical protein